MNNILKLVNMEARKVKVRNEETEEMEEITELQWPDPVAIPILSGSSMTRKLMFIKPSSARKRSL